MSITRLPLQTRHARSGACAMVLLLAAGTPALAQPREAFLKVLDVEIRFALSHRNQTLNRPDLDDILKEGKIPPGLIEEQWPLKLAGTDLPSAMPPWEKVMLNGASRALQRKSGSDFLVQLARELGSLLGDPPLGQAPYLTAGELPEDLCGEVAEEAAKRFGGDVKLWSERIPLLREAIAEMGREGEADLQGALDGFLLGLTQATQPTGPATEALVLWRMALEGTTCTRERVYTLHGLLTQAVPEFRQLERAAANARRAALSLVPATPDPAPRASTVPLRASAPSSLLARRAALPPVPATPVRAPQASTVPRSASAPGSPTPGARASAAHTQVKPKSKSFLDRLFGRSDSPLPAGKIPFSPQADTPLASSGAGAGPSGLAVDTPAAVEMDPSESASGCRAGGESPARSRFARWWSTTPARTRAGSAPVLGGAGAGAGAAPLAGSASGTESALVSSPRQTAGLSLTITNESAIQYRLLLDSAKPLTIKEHRPLKESETKLERKAENQAQTLGTAEIQKGIDLRKGHTYVLAWGEPEDFVLPMMIHETAGAGAGARVAGLTWSSLGGKSSLALPAGGIRPGHFDLTSTSLVILQP